MSTSVSTTLLEVRISIDLHTMLKRAAELQGRTITDFVISAVQKEAQQVIEKTSILELALADQACFANALLQPPAPAAALRRAFSRHNELITTKRSRLATPNQTSATSTAKVRK